MQNVSAYRIFFGSIAAKRSSTPKGVFMNTGIRASILRWLSLGAIALLAACAGQSQKAAAKVWKIDDLRTALAAPSRPQADRDRDADRKPAELMMVLGVKPGMTAIDLLAAGGYVTEVLSIAVGPTGKVYSQNAAGMLKMRGGAVDKALSARLADGHLPNVTRVDDSLPQPQVAPGSVDVAITVMNLHDIYNASGADAAIGFVKNVYSVLKPGGVFGVVDHVGVAGADNAKLHRMQKQQALDVAKAAGFIVEVDSNVLAHSADDHTKMVFDPTLRGKTDQFTLVLRKPK
jgi:predicted methyltransferase